MTDDRVEINEIVFGEEDRTGLEPLALSAEAELPPEVPKGAKLVDVPFMEPPLDADDRAHANSVGFVFADPHFELGMRDAVRSLYSAHGIDGLDALEAGLIKKQQEVWRERDMLEQFWKEREALEKIRVATIAAVTRSAMKVGHEAVLEACKKWPWEAKRYGGTPNLNDQWKLAGKDVLPLAQALLRVEPKRRNLEGRARARDVIDRSNEVLRDRGSDWRKYERKQEAEHAKAVEEARLADLIAAVADEGFEFPVLYRIWDNPALVERLASAVEDDPKKVTELVEFRDAVYDALTTVRDASEHMEEEFRSSDVEVWRYRRLIDEALSRSAVPVGSVEWRVCVEELARWEEKEGWVSRICMAAFLIEIVAIFVPGGQPVVLAMEAVQLAAMLYETAHKGAQYAADDPAFNSCFDPSESFASEPSLSSVLVSLAFTYWAARGVSRAYGVAKTARQAVP